MTETPEITTEQLAGMEIPAIEEAWQRALEPAAKVEAKIAALRRRARSYREWGGHYAEQAEGFAQEAYELEQNALEDAMLAEAPFRAEWDRRDGWTRYWLVPGGHLHHMSCSTIRPGRTLVGLLIAASGMTSAKVVETFQYTACTHCFPEAPVEAKLSAAEAGFCEHSGAYVGNVEGASVREGWWQYAVAPTAKCPCGYRGAITKTGKFRKHKPGEEQHADLR